ncbi:alpha/beta fold hydrolase [Nocardiopsis sp. CNT-189]|uniref:alpha/beta hydrolase family protein n=1 Tax=Nocardiopsis oceanisediminis TaxID=2816862 RepID=UPI003B2F5235
MEAESGERAPGRAEVLRYGAHPSQRIEAGGPVRRADGRPAPVAVLLHGGFWRDIRAADLMDPIAADLAEAGWRVWNAEYRRTGSDGGGWPQTLDDVRAALALLAERLPAEGSADRPDRVVAVGHSAGGHLALLAAPGSPLTSVVCLAPVTDLADTHRRGLGEGAVADFLGPEPGGAELRAASPVAQAPFGLPQLVLHGDRDQRVPLQQSLAYTEAARAAGDPVELQVLDGVDHFAVIDPAGPAWARARAWMEAPPQG